MIGEAGFHVNRADIKTHVLQFLDANVCRHFAQANGEERAFHLAGEHIVEPMAGAFVTENAQLILRFVNRKKKGKALNMVPMRVR